jgi:hypothetical protein
MADGEDEGAEQTIEEKFEAWYQQRTKREKEQADRRKEPKNFGEFLDRLSAAVVDEAERRAEARNAAVDDEDEEPTRGKRPGGFASWWQGVEQATG